MNVRINNLPDEILVDIFSYLTTAELLVIELISERFQRIVCEKRVVRRLDFRRCFNLNGASLRKFFTIKVRCSNVREVDFNGCSWLCSNDFSVLKKLHNLTALHILRCTASIKVVCELITYFKLTSLSLSWINEILEKFVRDKGQVKDSLKNLKNLVVEVTSPFQLSDIFLILSSCPLLETLNVREMTCLTQNYYSYRSFMAPQVIKLPHLKECKFFLRSAMGYSVESFICGLLSSSFSDSKIQGFWTSEAGCSVLVKLHEETDSTLHQIQDAKFVSLNGTRVGVLSVNRSQNYESQLMFAKMALLNGLKNCTRLSLDMQRIDGDLLMLIATKCPRLEHLSLKDCQVLFGRQKISDGLIALSEMCTQLTELSLLGTHIHTDFNPCNFIGKLKGLRILSISPCILASPLDSPEDRVGEPILSLGNRKRVGLQVTPTAANVTESRLYPVAENCVELRTLIIEINSDITMACEKLVNRVKDKDLFCIAKLAQLTTLKLRGLYGIRAGIFLPEICKSCPLQVLRLTDIGPKSHFVYPTPLMEALPHCTELQELKIEQKYDLSVTRIWESKSLLKCTKLETLWLISEGGPKTVFDRTVVFKLLNQLEKVVCFGLVQAISKEMCAKLSRDLRKTYIKSRPAFQCVVANNVGEIANHYEECFYERPLELRWNEIA